MQDLFDLITINEQILNIYQILFIHVEKARIMHIECTENLHEITAFHMFVGLNQFLLCNSQICSFIVNKIRFLQRTQSPRSKACKWRTAYLIDIGERAGSGVPELFAVWEHEGWEEPQIEERQDSVERTTVTLSFKKKVPKKATKKNRRKRHYCSMRQSYLSWSQISGIAQVSLWIFLV